MLLLDRQPGATSQPGGGASRPGVEASRVHLRQRANGQLVELPPGKTTIGSSPRCNVRIQQPGVQPLHCLIVHAPEGMTVRSWARDTELNGVSFEESALGVGDCLRLGPVELEVIDPQAQLPATAAQEVAIPETVGAGQFRAGRDLARTRSRKLLEILRRERTSQGELRQQVSDLQQAVRQGGAERDSISGKLESALAELAAARQQFSEFKGLEVERDKLAEQNQELGFEIGELSVRINELAHGQAMAAKDRQQLANDYAAMNEQHRQLAEEKSRLQNEVRELTNQQSAVCGERDELRRQNDQLQTEIRALSAERVALSDDRAAICQERNELQEYNEQLQACLAQVHEEKSAMAVGSLTVIEQRDLLSQQNDQLQARIAGLTEENAALVADKQVFSVELTQLHNENQRLVELERETRAAVASRESASAELYNALLQIAELQERIDKNYAAVAAYDSLNNEHEQLIQEVDQLKAQVTRQDEERAAVESAWQALSDEAAGLSESQQRLAGDNSKLLASLDDVRQQLEQTRQDNLALAGTVTALERELAAKQPAESAAAAAIAESERQFSDRARQFAETAGALEQRLAAALDVQNSLGRAVDEWQHRCAEVESVSAEQSRRILALEAQVAVAEARAAEALAAQPTDHAKSPVASDWNGATPAAAPINWSPARRESVSHDTPSASSAANVFAQSSTDEPESGDAPWGGSSPPGDEWRSMRADIAGAGQAADESSPWSGQSSGKAPIAGNAFGDSEASGASQPEPTNWLASLGANSPDEPGEEAASFAAQQESFDAPAGPEGDAAKRTQSTSFIERYSHMFAGDGPANDEPKLPFTQQGPAAEAATSKPRVMGDDRSGGNESPSAKSDEEESIEQYMAKLLQRVRGDSSSNASDVVQPTAPPLKTQVVINHSGARMRTAPLAPPAASSEAGETIQAVPEIDGLANCEAAKRKATTPAPATDLGALRALANETARRDISRHELRKHRRNAVTKVIVSTLAGVTSLWMMLDSPDWRDIQFITACVSLLVAAIWAGETYRTLLESLRAAAYDGPDSGVYGSDSEIQPPALPIDVEERS